MSGSVSSSSAIFDFQKFAAKHKNVIETQLHSYLAQEAPPQLWQSMRYSVLSGGKRMRALLCLACAECVDTLAVNRAMPLACAIEMVHAMSLIHDDLPCMDNDDFRRGQPANHKVFGEAGALLAGDGLLAYVFELLVKEMRHQIATDVLLDIIEKFARALGPYGMVAGQSEDLALTGSGNHNTSCSSVQGNDHRATTGDKDTEVLRSMHSKKTGALISFSAWGGATIAGAPSTLADALKQYGEILGLAFQITDDLLDVTGDIKNLGKTPGKDQASDKTTWVSIWGVQQSKKYLLELQKQASRILQDTGIRTDSLLSLKSLLQYVIERQN